MKDLSLPVPKATAATQTNFALRKTSFDDANVSAPAFSYCEPLPAIFVLDLSPAQVATPPCGSSCAISGAVAGAGAGLGVVTPKTLQQLREPHRLVF